MESPNHRMVLEPFVDPILYIIADPILYIIADPIIMYLFFRSDFILIFVSNIFDSGII